MAMSLNELSSVLQKEFSFDKSSENRPVVITVIGNPPGFLAQAELTVDDPENEAGPVKLQLTLES